MSDTNWKKLERTFGKVWAKMLGCDPFQRNDSRLNAGDSELNSDVDVVHKSLRVHEKGKILYKGIVGECRHIKGGSLGYIKKNLQRLTKDSSKELTPIIVLNKIWACHWLRHGYDVWHGLSDSFQASHYIIEHVDVKYNMKLLLDKWGQVSRYAKAKKLYPVVCFGFHNIQPVEIFNLKYKSNVR